MMEAMETLVEIKKFSFNMRSGIERHSMGIEG